MSNSKFTASKKRIILIISAIVALIAIVAGGTFAWYTDMVSAKANTFTAGTVSCEVSESFDSAVKENVSVKNTGDVDAYVRAALVINWVDEKGIIYAAAPVAGEDYTLDVDITNWFKADDGYYYCKDKVAPENYSAILVNSCQQIESSAAPEGYHLQVNVIASAIQANPADAVNEAWTSVTVISGQLADKNSAM